MALYRFLFAPVLLAVAVIVGSGEKAAPKQPERPPAVEPARPAAAVAPVGPAVTPVRGRHVVAPRAQEPRVRTRR